MRELLNVWEIGSKNTHKTRLVCSMGKSLEILRNYTRLVKTALKKVEIEKSFKMTT